MLWSVGGGFSQISYVMPLSTRVVGGRRGENPLSTNNRFNEVLGGCLKIRKKSLSTFGTKWEILTKIICNIFTFWHFWCQNWTQNSKMVIFHNFSKVLNICVILLFVSKMASLRFLGSIMAILGHLNQLEKWGLPPKTSKDIILGLFVHTRSAPPTCLFFPENMLMLSAKTSSITSKFFKN